ncbi:Protein of unknown function (DUF1822) [Rivularia sp. PCC 7116]|uniref:DUF1822 family protein n=1 Tax=Rivularia sp. PCC 7116 TaxID=373994 RepID=UPI00029EDC3E|nr:DUF1822 family protein [Rivularia sp. PCC 7116]AFY55336.1 Protein of unknown function (DUF1822) [Rivularia sp. PCC 7116]
MNSTTQKLSFTVNLSFEAHSIAQELVSKISNQKKRQQIYLNSLAVFAVNHYLLCMGFETDYLEGDSRNPVAVQLMNVADLIVKDIGKLECIPILAETEVVEIPPEVWEDRVGYIFVELNDSLKEANILGFIPKARDKVFLSKLNSLEDFLVYLTELEVVESVQAETTSHVISFRQWWDGVIDTSWQKVEQLLNPQQLGLAYRSNMSLITRGQKIDLGMHLDQISVALVMKVMSESDSEEVDILTQVYPVGEMALPEGIKLIIGDETGEGSEVVSREDDNWIQSEFSAESGERFSITVAYGDSEVKKEFEV